MTAASGAATCSVAKLRSCCAISWRGLLVLVAVVAVLGVAAWVERQLLLRMAADVWIVSDQPAHADAVAVFGGGIEDRPFAAAAYYRGGLVKKVLLSNNLVGPAAQLGILPSDVAANREILLKLGVPEHDIETFGSGLSNTHDEVLALREWARRTGAKSIIVPTEIFSARRVRWMLRRAFGNEIDICVPALDSAQYHANNWWRHEAGLIDFQNEAIKYVYYRLRY
jgi:uncharacterized SAM-binding protein YcdF (DUF218 family)